MGMVMETTEVKLGTATYWSRPMEPRLFGDMGAPGELYSDTFHTIAINTHETEFGSIVEPIPITLKAYKHFNGHGVLALAPGAVPVPTITSFMASRGPDYGRPASSVAIPVSVPIAERKDVPKTSKIIAPPKKKWIKEYLEEEPKSPVCVRVVQAPSPPRVLPVAPAPAPAPELPAIAPAPPLLDFAQEHSRPRTTTNNSHGATQIPSPPSGCSSGSGGSSGSAPRAGTREVHNKLEKNRRAHLKECFELLKRQLPATPDDKKTSNLSILGSAIRYIQVLRRKERECEHEMERLAREKIAAQQRLAALKREVSVRASARVRPRDPVSDDKVKEEHVNGQILGISIGASPPRGAASPPHSMGLSSKLRTLPIQITPTTSQQVVRTSYGGRHNTLTLTTLAPAPAPTDHTSQQNGQQLENGVTNAISTTLVHPAQIHLPISQVVSSGGLVVGSALQLLSAGAGLRVLQAPVRPNGVTTVENNRLPEPKNGIVTSSPVSTTEGVVVSGLTPLVVSHAPHAPHAPHAHAALLQGHTLTHKMVETAMVSGGVSVSQYLSAAATATATALVKPVVVVSTHEPT